MKADRYSLEEWQSRYQPVANWDDSFRERRWDALGDISQTARHAVIAGYIHKLVGRGLVLDAGCGEGVLFPYFDPERIDYTGFDVSPTAIERAREHYPAARVFSSSIEDFSPPLGVRYDAIVFNDALSTLEAPIEMVDRYFAFISDNGHMIISQYQPPPGHNGAIFTSMFEAELEAGRYRAIVRSEVSNVSTGQRWRCYCLSKD